MCAANGIRNVLRHALVLTGLVKKATMIYNRLSKKPILILFSFSVRFEEKEKEKENEMK